MHREWAGLHSVSCDEKSLKLHRRSLEMKFCFSMTHTYTSICRASVNPAPSSSFPLPPSFPHGPQHFPCAAGCLLLHLTGGGYRLQRLGRPPFRHVSVIEGRNLARLDRPSACGLHLLACPVGARTHRRMHMRARGTMYFFRPLLFLKKMSGLPLLHNRLGPAT